jgi:bacterial/archaeal transporter family-2 protein
VLIPIMASLSGTLGRALDNPWAASAIVMSGAFAMVIIVTLAMGGANISWETLKRVNPLQLAAGFGMGFYLLAATWLTPRFGVGNMVMFVLVGQLLIAAVIDQFGLFGAPRKPIDLMRVGGLAIMIVGIVIAQLAAANAKPAE